MNKYRIDFAHIMYLTNIEHRIYLEDARLFLNKRVIHVYLALRFYILGVDYSYYKEHFRYL